MTDQFTLFLIIFMAISVTTSTLFAFIMIRRMRLKQGGLMGVDSGVPDVLSKGKEVCGTYNGTEYYQQYTPGGRNVPSSYKIKIDCPSSGSFRISRETGFDRFFKALGIAKEIQTGNKEFDNKFFIKTDAVNFTRMFFMSTDKSRAISDVFKYGFTQVEHDGKTMAAVFSPVRFKNPLDDTLIQEIVTRLTVLAQNIHEQSGESIHHVNQGWKVKRVVAFAIPGFLYIVGIPAFLFGLLNYAPLDKWTLFLSTLKYSVPSFLAFLILALKLIKGRSTSHRELIIILAISIVSFPFAGMGLGTFLNGWLDKSDPTTHAARIMDKYTTSSKNGDNYYLVLESWREKKHSESVSVSSRDYARAKPNKSKMRVLTKPGYYDFEWIISTKLE